MLARRTVTQNSHAKRLFIRLAFYVSPLSIKKGFGFVDEITVNKVGGGGVEFSNIRR